MAEGSERAARIEKLSRELQQHTLKAEEHDLIAAGHRAKAQECLDEMQALIGGTPSTAAASPAPRASAPPGTRKTSRKFSRGMPYAERPYLGQLRTWMDGMTEAADGKKRFTTDELKHFGMGLRDMNVVKGTFYRMVEAGEVVIERKGVYVVSNLYAPKVNGKIVEAPKPADPAATDTPDTRDQESAPPALDPTFSPAVDAGQSTQPLPATDAHSPSLAANSSSGA